MCDSELFTFFSGMLCSSISFSLWRICTGGEIPSIPPFSSSNLFIFFRTISWRFGLCILKGNGFIKHFNFHLFGPLVDYIYCWIWQQEPQADKFIYLCSYALYLSFSIVFCQVCCVCLPLYYKYYFQCLYRIGLYLLFIFSLVPYYMCSIYLAPWSLAKSCFHLRDDLQNIIEVVERHG